MAMRLPISRDVQLVTTAGITIHGRTARSGQWSVHRINKAVIYNRDDPEQLLGYVLIPAENVLFVQISPAEE